MGVHTFFQAFQVTREMTESLAYKSRGSSNPSGLDVRARMMPRATIWNSTPDFEVSSADFATSLGENFGFSKIFVNREAKRRTPVLAMRKNLRAVPTTSSPIAYLKRCSMHESYFWCRPRRRSIRT
jgi:hypothetical protein